MLGLIKKDLFLIKSNLKSMAIILIVYIAMAIQGTFDITMILPLFGMILLISTFNYDEYNNWYSYAIALPTSRKSIVKSKYIFASITLGFTWLMGIVISLLITYFKNNVNIAETISVITGSLLGIVLLIAFLFPLIFKYGAEKGRIGIFVLVFGTALLVTVFSKYIDVSSLKNLAIFLDNHLYVLPIIPIVLLLISYKISEKIFLKKEF